ncbi:MAG: mandelate racemase/muconate lactonizing enzyme family protein [Candidatus Latescibacteria bacterium]|jgi:L-alanine-DL-glutamate epimerase-like enolase superfamily enzyme|nr:mandelate racemase/muconate lactonizing enzyme family protein [Candidatus Latescibacterota bacterium]
MQIEKIEIYIYKHDHHYMLRGVEDTPNRISGTDYFFEPHWRQSYSRVSEACLVKLTTDTGIEGWGEAQAPLMPEMAGTLIHKLFGPYIKGQNPLERERLYDDMYHINNIRGHESGYTLDAMAAIDIALWDIAGRYYSAPIFELLGGPCKGTGLPAYVSGLRQPTLDEQCTAAQHYIQDGFQAIKLFLGDDLPTDIRILRSIREAVGPDVTLFCDLLWRYRVDEVIRIGRVLDELKYSWLEAPTAPEDLAGHKKIGEALDVPIAIGEPLRTVYEFLPWFEQRLLGIAQPDVMRTGLTAAKKIAAMAEAFRIPVAPHVGMCTGIGMAATLQFAAAIPNFLIQEYQLNLMIGANRTLSKPIEVKDGTVIPPSGPGLGVDIENSAIEECTTAYWSI